MALPLANVSCEARSDGSSSPMQAPGKLLGCPLHPGKGVQHRNRPVRVTRAALGAKQYTVGPDKQDCAALTGIHLDPSLMTSSWAC